MNNLKSFFIKAGIFLGSCLLTCAAFEIAIRVVALRKDIYTIEMVKYAKELKMTDPKGVSSHVHRPNASAKLMGTDISLNSWGHRGPERSRRIPSTKRIFLLGSSITMGWGVPYEDVFSTVVEKHLNEKGKGVEIFNAGIGNYNTYYQYLLFKDQFERVDPDMVVLHYFINDAEPNPVNSNPLARYSYLAAYLNSEFQGMYFKYFGTRDLVAYYSDLYRDENPQWQKTVGYINEMKAAADQKNIPFLIVIVPDTHNLDKGSPYEGLYQNIETRFSKMQIPTLNLFADFQERFGDKETNLWVASDDPHPNATGHALMAETLEKYLLKQPLFGNDRKLPNHS